MEDVHARQPNPADPEIAALPALVKSTLRYVDDLNWFEPADLRFVEAMPRRSREAIYVFEYAPTGRHLFLDRRGRMYQFEPASDPTKSGRFRLHHSGPKGVAGLRPEFLNQWNESPYGPDRYNTEPWDDFDSESFLRLVDDEVVADEWCSTQCYGDGMRREITQRELRNQSGEIMRALDAGDEFVVTRNGVPVGELLPLRRKHFTSTDKLLEQFRGAPSVDYARLRADLDAVVDQDPTPRG